MITIEYYTGNSTLEVELTGQRGQSGQNVPEADQRTSSVS